jgi:hypothetical protein
MDSSDASKKNFFKHVFNFDSDSKADMLNIVQYSLIATIPVVLLNKSMAKYVPEADEQKGSLEISAEIIVQIITMFVGLLIIHRMITFVPTYSEVKYPEFNMVFIVLAVLMITMSLQTKLGEKVGILFDRVSDLWNGTGNDKNAKKGKKGNVKVTQPISGQQTPNQAAINQAIYNDGTSISSLPTQAPTQNLPDYDSMHRKENVPLMGAASPEQFSNFEPVAANAGGFAAFGSSW